MLSSIDGIGMKLTGEGMMVGIALEDFNGEQAVGEAVIDQLNDNNAKPTAAQKVVVEDDPCYVSGGGEVGEEKCKETSKNSRTRVITDAKEAQETTSIVASDHLAAQHAEATKMHVKIGTIQMFVSLGWSRLDPQISQASTSTVAITWFVDRLTGELSTDYFTNVDFKGIAFNKIRSIGSFNNKWSIDENGKVTAEVVEAKAITATESLEIGTQARPRGITIYDTITNEPYCMQLANGAMKPVKGKCDDISVESPVIPREKEEDDERESVPNIPEVTATTTPKTETQPEDEVSTSTPSTSTGGTSGSQTTPPVSDEIEETTTTPPPAEVTETDPGSETDTSTETTTGTPGTETAETTGTPGTETSGSEESTDAVSGPGSNIPEESSSGSIQDPPSDESSSESKPETDDEPVSEPKTSSETESAPAPQSDSASAPASESEAAPAGA
jgi:hypothetical protein